MPSTAYNFSDLLTLVRAGKGSIWDAAGNYAEVANNLPRLTYDQLTLAPRGLLIHTGRTNLLTNPRAEGAVSGGAMPTGWGMPGAIQGIAFQNLGPVAVNGMTGLRFRVFGTATADGSASMNLGPNAAASQNTPYVLSAYVRAVAGSPAPLRNFDLRMRFLNAANAQLSGLTSSMKAADGVIRRFNYTFTTPADASGSAADTVTQAQAICQFNWLNGAVVDFTFDIFFPQLEVSGGASPPILPNAGTIAQSSSLGDTITATNLMLSGVNTTGFTAIATFQLDYLTTISSNFHEIFQMNDAAGGSGDAIRLHSNSAGALVLRTVIAGTTVSTSLPNMALPLAEHTVAVSIEPGFSRVSLDGAAAVQSATTGIPSGVNRMWVGNGGSSGTYLSGTLKRLDFLPRAVTAAELAALSVANS